MTVVPACQRRLKSHLKRKFGHIFEGVPTAGKRSLLNDIYTELYITEGGGGPINDEHEISHVESSFRKMEERDVQINYEDIFRPGRHGPIRTVLTRGVAGIGKTVVTHKFALDWAEGKSNRGIHFTFPFTFRELNVLREEEYSLVGLLGLFFGDVGGEAWVHGFRGFEVVFILDGLDECRFPLDFRNNRTLSDITQPAPVDVLLTSLIRGDLLPSAQLWITTRPAAAHLVPSRCVDLVTEVRGFTDAQKTEYFKRRFASGEQAERVVAHIRQSRSVHIMCHIPIFCWIAGSILEPMLRRDEKAALPKTLTDMYIHFLLVQTKQMNEKLGRPDSGTPWNTGACDTTMALGKLAFDQLQKGNLIFYESDLVESNIDVAEALVYSGLLTQIFQEESGLYLQKVFCFVHLSIQEFLAALYVYVTFVNTGVSPLSQPRAGSWWAQLFQTRSKEQMFFQTAVDAALWSQNGHLDLFLRFLLGFSLKTSQDRLRGLLKPRQTVSYDTSETASYIKQKIQESPSSERCINLFHCLHELKDNSLVEEIQQHMSLGRLSTDNLSPAQWSALAFFLLSSENETEVFDLRKFSATEEGLLRLLRVLHIYKTAV